MKTRIIEPIKSYVIASLIGNTLADMFEMSMDVLTRLGRCKAKVIRGPSRGVHVSDISVSTKRPRNLRFHCGRTRGGKWA